MWMLNHSVVSLWKSDFLVDLDHIFCDLKDSFAEGFRCEHLDLVAVSEYPPGDFIKAVDAKLNDCRAVIVACNFLCAVPFYLSDIISNFGQEVQLDVIDSAFRHH